MARCPLCESDVPDGRADCDACGQPFDQPPTVQAGAGEVQRALAAAKKDISTAGQDPADVAFPQRRFARAEQEVAAGHLGPALDLARAARRATGIIRREARVADALARADAVIAEATTAGIDTETFRRNVEQARAIASRGDHASAERLLTRVSPPSLDERRENARHTSLEKAEAALREVRREASREKRKGADVTRAEVLLDQAEVAMATKDFGKVKGLATDAHDAVREATLIKTVRDAFASLQMDRDDLKNLGADIAGFEQTLVRLGAAIEGQDVGAARRLVAEARHTAETARDAHFRAVMENSLQIVLANAARGLDPQVARQLLREVDDAIHNGKPIDMQALIDRRMADQDTETQERLNVRVLQARDDIVALRQSGQNDTVGLEGKLADAAMAVEDRRLVQADALLDSVEHDISATRESLRSTAAETLGQARGEVARGRADGIVLEAAEQMLTDAETSYSEARYGDTIYAGKACISEVEELARASLEAKRQSDAEDTRVRVERTDGIHRRMEAVRAQIADLLTQNIDLARATDVLTAAEQAVVRGSLEEAEHLLSSAEGLVEGVRVTFNGQAQDALRRTRTVIANAHNEGIDVGEFSSNLAKAEADFQAGRPGSVLDAVGLVNHTLSERRRNRQLEEQRIALEKARTAATRRSEEHTSELQSPVHLVCRLLLELRRPPGSTLFPYTTLFRSGIDIGEFSSKLSKAEADFQAGRPGSVLDAVGLVNHTLSERRRNRQLEEQRIALEKARTAATRFITVKKLIESLRKADIDIAGA